MVESAVTALPNLSRLLLDRERRRDAVRIGRGRRDRLRVQLDADDVAARRNRDGASPLYSGSIRRTDFQLTQRSAV
jgi:hypothetical protein